MEVKVAPIECDLEQLVQRGDAAVTAHVQTPPNGWVNLEEQNVELVNFGGRAFDWTIVAQHRLARPLSAPGFSRSPYLAEPQDSRIISFGLMCNV
jgi:hypothetical protein